MSRAKVRLIRPSFSLPRYHHTTPVHLIVAQCSIVFYCRRLCFTALQPAHRRGCVLLVVSGYFYIFLRLHKHPSTPLQAARKHIPSLNHSHTTLITMPVESPTSQHRPINVKLLMIGHGSVGKSSLLLRFTDQQWRPEHEAKATIGVDTWVNASVKFSALVRVT